MHDPARGDQLTTEGEFDELIAEYHRKTDRGEPVDPAAFIAANPDFRDQLKQYFADLEVVEKMAGPTAAMDTSVTDATVINGLVASAEAAQQPESPEPAIDDSGIQAGAYAGAPVTTTSTGEVPEQFGRYRILKELGRGAMGAVYLAEDEQLQRKVALKVPKFPDGMSSELLERFYREARAAGNLRHPGICPVYDVGEIDGQHFITMAYIEGRPLKSLTESGRPQDITVVAGIIQKIAEAMAVAHKQGVIHRDLKPANVMLDTEGQPVVMDFGLARRSVDNEEKLTQTGMVLGSPAYMSPEQVDSDNDKVGPPADIYTLGVIFYELLTGGLPFQGGLMSILRQISMDQPRPIVELRGDVDPVIQELCLKMLAKQVDDRPASMQDVARQLSDWVEGQRVARGEAATLALPSDRVPPPMAEKVGKSDKQPETTSDSKARSGISDSVNSGRNRKLLLAGGLGGAVLLLAGLTFFFRLGKYDVQITLEDPSITLSVDDGALVISGTDNDTIRLTDGPHKLTAQIGDFTAELDEFNVKKDGNNVVYVALIEDKLVINPPGKAAVPNIPPTNTQPMRTPLPDNAWIEVLSQVDPEADCRSGTVTQTERGYRLTTPPKDEEIATLAIPVELSGHYRVQLHVTPGTSDDIYAILPVKNRLVSVNINNGKARLCRIDDKFIGAESPLPEGMYGFRGEIEVRPFDDQVQVIVRADGNTILDWSGRQDQLRQIPMGGMVPGRDKTALCVWGQEPGYTGDVHDFRIAAVDGVAKLLRPRVGTKSVRANEITVPSLDENIALEFGNGSDRVDLPTLSNEAGPYTIEAWLALSAQQSTRSGTILEFRGPTQRGRLGLGNDAIFNHAGVLGGRYCMVTSPESERVGIDCHVAATWDGNEGQLYVNGRLAKAQWKRFQSISLGSSSCWFGADPAGKPNSFFGRLYEARISRVARYTADFVPAARLEADDSTVALYHFDEGTGDVLKDSSGNGHDGRIVGAKWIRLDRVDSEPAGGSTPPPAVAPFDEAQAKAHQQHPRLLVENEVALHGGETRVFGLNPSRELLMESIIQIRNVSRTTSP